MNNIDNNQPEDDFEDKFRKKFDGWDAPVPDWNDFSKKMPFLNTQENRKPKGGWLFFSSYIFLALLGGIGAYFLYQNNFFTPKNNQVSNKTLAQNHIQIHNKNHTLNAKNKREISENTQEKNKKLLKTQENTANFSLNKTDFPFETQENKTLLTKETQEKNKNFLENKTLLTKETQEKSNRLTPLVGISKDILTPPLGAGGLLIDTTFKTTFPRIKKWEFQFSIGILSNQKIISPNRNDSIFISRFAKSGFQTEENGGWQIGLRAERNLGRNWGVYGGVHVQARKLTFDYTQQLYPANYMVTNVSNTEIMVNPNAKTEKQYLVYGMIGLEFGVSYKRHFGRFSTVAQAGFGIRQVTIDAKEDYQRNLLPQNQTFVQTGLQLHYTLSRDWGVFFAPSLQYNFQDDITPNSLFSVRSFQIVQQVGVKMKF